MAVYTDGAYNSFLGGVAFAMYDVERVEVLRGPQGTLFGRNATGGVKVRFVIDSRRLALVSASGRRAIGRSTCK